MLTNISPVSIETIQFLFELRLLFLKSKKITAATKITVATKMTVATQGSKMRIESWWSEDNQNGKSGRPRHIFGCPHFDIIQNVICFKFPK